jgi:DNA-binding NarL/FixJ family response regulator
MKTLNEEELKALQMIADGASNRKLADELHWSIGYIDRLLTRIYEKLGIEDGNPMTHKRPLAVATAIRKGIIQ